MRGASRRLASALDRRPLRFAAVGASGVFVNQLVLLALGEAIGVHYLVAAFVAVQVSAVWNFLLSEHWVFPSPAAGRVARGGSFLAMNVAAFTLHGPLLFALTALGGLHYGLANAVALLVLFAARYAFSDRIIWGRAALQPARVEVRRR
jgi:putative flippase GtrA